MSNYGVVFDFNGTLFWDTIYQNNSWYEYLKTYDMTLSQKELEEHVHGRNAIDTFEYIFQRKLSHTEVDIMIEEKEVLYRLACDKDDVELAPGCISLINYLLENNIKIAIATASGKSNMDYFIEKFDLLKYFNKENIIYNDGTSKGKPNPDLFLKAVDSLKIPNENVIIFEDSKSGIQAANRANVMDVIIVDSNDDHFDMYNYKRINHFDQFDRSIFDRD